MGNAIELRNVTKRYPGFAVENISFALPEGCIMGLIGENGAGKTTIIKMILDLVRQDAGEIDVFGKPIWKNGILWKEQVGVVMDECGFPENLSAKNINGILKNTYRTWKEEVFYGYCDRFQLPLGKAVKDYSRGMKMKLSIAAALSHDSRLLVLDEATSGLDPIVRDEILDLFLEFIQEETHSVLISSHIISDLEKICDYITFLHQGKIIFSEEKDVLLERYAVAKCSREEFEGIDPRAVVGVRKNRFGVEALVYKKRLNRDVAADPATIEEIMLYYAKEEKSCRD